MAKALFLDRDGVINIDHGYVYKVADFEFVPGVLAMCKRFFLADYQLVIVTNQSGIARGFYQQEDFESLTTWLKAQFEKNGSPLAGVYHCPHGPDDNCRCRKPRPGMLLQAARELNLTLSESIMIGDKASDMIAAKEAGVPDRVFFTSEHVYNLAENPATYTCKNFAELNP